ncbi:hypothetical protein FHX72_001131 [Pseudoclavibacter helvolus]|uniref:Uncharacterized protein n=1 Tax=Pseudoclavibacter helvolus TaxID=255205 RepID=A0A7W4YE04_9MICO|nr:hypothetical protein [Pseudoclavibacter helvolus]
MVRMCNEIRSFSYTGFLLADATKCVAVLMVEMTKPLNSIAR